MVIPSARKLLQADYTRIETALSSRIDKAKREQRKPTHAYLDIAAFMAGIYNFTNAYIVADSYLVCYEVIQPWWTKDGDWLLAEQLVLRLSVSGADFRVVPEFLTAQAREAGCVLAAVGTALALSDKPLASLYSRHGFQPSAASLAKDTSGLSV